jgi:hypothetical protein
MVENAGLAEPPLLFFPCMQAGIVPLLSVAQKSKVRLIEKALFSRRFEVSNFSYLRNAQ